MYEFRNWMRRLARELGYSISWPKRNKLVHFKPGVESLEVRVQPSTYTVSNTGDSGAGSLREAITPGSSRR